MLTRSWLKTIEGDEVRPLARKGETKWAKLGAGGNQSVYAVEYRDETGKWVVGAAGTKPCEIKFGNSSRLVRCVLPEYKRLYITEMGAITLWDHVHEMKRRGVTSPETYISFLIVEVLAIISNLVRVGVPYDDFHLGNFMFFQTDAGWRMKMVDINAPSWEFGLERSLWFAFRFFLEQLRDAWGPGVAFFDAWFGDDGKLLPIATVRNIGRTFPEYNSGYAYAHRFVFETLGAVEDDDTDFYAAVDAATDEFERDVLPAMTHELFDWIPTPEFERIAPLEAHREFLSVARWHDGRWI